jgi:hypothetical protein
MSSFLSSLHDGCYLTDCGSQLEIRSFMLLWIDEKAALLLLYSLVATSHSVSHQVSLIFLISNYTHSSRITSIRSNGTAFRLLVRVKQSLTRDVSPDHSRNALILGILYLAFQAFPIIFEGVHRFNMQMTGLTFIGIGLGMFSAISTQPYWNRWIYLFLRTFQR